MFSIWAKQQTIPSISASDSSKIQSNISLVVSAGLLVSFLWLGYSSFARAPHRLQVSVSGGRQTRSLFYPVCQLHHVCRVDAEEDVQDFRPIRPGLDPPEIVVFLLCPERAFHRSRPRSGKFLSDKVFLLILLSASKLKKPQHLLGLCLVFVQYKIVHDWWLWFSCLSDFFKIDR